MNYWGFWFSQGWRNLVINPFRVAAKVIHLGASDGALFSLDAGDPLSMVWFETFPGRSSFTRGDVWTTGIGMWGRHCNTCLKHVCLPTTILGRLLCLILPWCCRHTGWQNSFRSTTGGTRNATCWKQLGRKMLLVQDQPLGLLASSETCNMLWRCEHLHSYAVLCIPYIHPFTSLGHEHCVALLETFSDFSSQRFYLVMESLDATTAVETVTKPQRSLFFFSSWRRYEFRCSKEMRIQFNGFNRLCVDLRRCHLSRFSGSCLTAGARSRCFNCHGSLFPSHSGIAACSGLLQCHSFLMFLGFIIHAVWWFQRAEDVAKAVAHIHKRGVIHRDIKPATCQA